MLFLFLLFSPVMGEDCLTLEGTPCSTDHPYMSYFKANPCFKHGDVGDVCFFNSTNNVKRCDCMIDACNCDADPVDSSSPDDSPPDSQQCQTTDGATCNRNHPYNNYFKANPCFGYSDHGTEKEGENYGKVCFFGDSNSIRSCDCSISACNCGSGDKACKEQNKKYCPLGNDNTMCKYCGVDSYKCRTTIITREIKSATEKAAIVDKHNDLRRKLAKGEEHLGSRFTSGSQPSAANMNELVWCDEVAKMAQTWADQCADKPHDDNRKMVDGSASGMYCGQNVFNAWSTSGPSKTKTLAGAVQAWYDEVKDFDKSAVKKFFSKGGGHTGVVGHYTQAVWADISTVGCGYVYRKDPIDRQYYRETVVCNYCKGGGGNVGGRPIYKTGAPASDCPKDHPTAIDGLCSPAT